MRLALLFNAIGIVLAIAAVWQGVDGRFGAAMILAAAALAVAFLRERF